MHEMEHHAISTKTIPKVASIELINSAFQSANVDAQDSHEHRVSKSLGNAFLKTELEKYDRKIYVLMFSICLLPGQRSDGKR